MQRSPFYSRDDIKSTFRRYQLTRNRRSAISVARPGESIPFVIDVSQAASRAQVATELLCDHADQIVGKTVAIGSHFHFGEAFSVANDLRIEIDTLVVLPGPSKSSERANAFAAALGAVIDAGKGTGRLFWFGGRVAFMVPTKTPLEAWLGEMKGHEMIPARGLDHWPREGLRTVVASTSRTKALPFRNIVRLTDYEKWGSLLAVSEIDHCGPNFAFLKELAPHLPNPIKVLD